LITAEHYSALKMHKFNETPYLWTGSMEELISPIDYMSLEYHFFSGRDSETTSLVLNL
jgi:hypothetical protein